jgi:hypothetical protein
MNKLRFLVAVFALFTLAACGDVSPTAPQEADTELRGFLGSGGGGMGGFLGSGGGG